MKVQATAPTRKVTPTTPVTTSTTAITSTGMQQAIIIQPYSGLRPERAGHRKVEACRDEQRREHYGKHRSALASSVIPAMMAARPTARRPRRSARVMFTACQAGLSRRGG